MPRRLPAVERWRDIAARAAERYSVNVADVLATVHRESRGDPDAVSKTGYRGLGQIGRAALASWRRMTGQSGEWPAAAMDPATNLDVVAWYLSLARDVANALGYRRLENVAMRAAIYGWGPGNVKNAVRRWQHERKTDAVPTLGELRARFPDAGKPNIAPWRAAAAHLRLRRVYGAAAPPEPAAESGCCAIVPLAALGALAALALAMIVAGVVS